MQSKKSFFNAHLYKKNLKRFWPVWGFASLISFFVMLINMSVALTFVSPVEAAEIYDRLSRRLTEGMLGYSIGLVFVLAPIAAMCVLAYLYKSNSVSFFHSLPITRAEHFGTAVFSGLTIMTIPNVVGFVTILFTTINNSFSLIPELFFWFGCTLAFELFFFSFAMLCGLVAGQILVLPILYLVFTLYVDVMQMPINELFDYIFFGYNNNLIDSGSVGILSPIDYMAGIGYNHRWIGEEYIAELYANSYRLIFIIIGALIFTAAAFFAYKKRHSETAGDTIAIKKVTGAIIWIASITFSLMFSFLFIELLPLRGNGSSINKVLVYIIILFFAIIGFFAFWMIQKKTFRVFKSKAVEGLIFAAVVTAAYLCIVFALYKYESYMPEDDEIVSIDVQNSGMDIRYTKENSRKIVKDIHKYLIQHKDELISDYTYNSSNGYIEFSYVEITYNFKNGETLNRNYRLYVYEKQNNDLTDEVLKMFDELYASDPVAALFRTDDYYPERIVGGNASIFWKNDKVYDYFDLTSAEARRLTDAALRDVEFGNVKVRDIMNQRFKYSYTDDMEVDYYTSEYLGYIDVEIRDPHNTYSNFIEISISRQSKEILRTLDEIGVFYNNYYLD